MTISVPRRRVACGASWIAALFVVAGSIGCKAKPDTIQDGSQVKFHYVLTVDGQTVDSSRSAEPLSIVMGSGQIIPGLEEKIRGLSKGDRREIVVPPEKGYGPVKPEAIQKVPRKNFQGAADIKVGSTVTAQDQGRLIQARITEVGKDHFTVDMNHPMAGKTLNFDIEIMDVASPETAQAGQDTSSSGS